MNVGDLVKPRGYQQIVKRSLKNIKSGIVLRIIKQDASGMLIKRYLVLWSNKKIIEHSWIEIELLQGVENGI